MRNARSFDASLLVFSMLLGGLASVSYADGWEGWHEVKPPMNTRYLVQNDRVVEIKSMSNGCNSEVKGDLIGTVVKVEYGEDEIGIDGAVIEMVDGERVYINIDALDAEGSRLSMVDLGWLSQGISDIVRKGNKVEVGVFYCGAAGRVLLVTDLRYGSEP